ncbi:MAG: ABC transporter ATP-binding protein [Desulfuromonas sp.]|mgnify:CR=1 FL=1|nr:MAG: ABC transporter ATP-binding protein [Desulfuromonas sp.]
MTDTTWAVDARGLKKCFGNLTAVASLDLQVASGTIYGLIGPDGAGKTTTLRMISGLLRPDQGEAFVAGFSSLQQPDEVKDRMAYMSQRFALYPDLTVDENIRFYADLYGMSRQERRDRTELLLDFSTMRPFRQRRAGQLSGGMKQKLQLICALIHKPEVLLLDEPTNGVDPVSRRDFWRILYDLVGEGMAIIVSTAYLDEAERCERVGLLHQGQLISEGTPAQVVKESGLHIVSVQCSRCIEAARLLKEHLSADQIHLYGDKVRVRCDDADAMIRQLKQWLPDVGAIRQERAELEDIFMTLQVRDERHDALISQVAQGIERQQGDAVVTRDLTRTFGSFTAVDQITLQVPYGEIFGFLGPNGAGKSTTIRMLCGLLTPSGGSGQVAGFDLARHGERIKTRIGYMSQKFSLYEDLRVVENIDFYGGIYGLSGKKLAMRRDWALQLSGLEERRYESTAALAGGWRQRLALACAILHAPPIVFLDEPTSGADPASRRLFWEIINELADHGVTVFVSTHYMEEAEYCDRLALIYRGAMIASGTATALKKDHDDGSLLKVAVERPQSWIEALTSLPAVREATLFGAGLHVKVADSQQGLSQIEQYFARQPVEAQVAVTEPTMEDVFIHLIEQARGDD